MSVRLEHSKKWHALADSGEETLCGLSVHQIMDGGDWWESDCDVTCSICKELGS